MSFVKGYLQIHPNSFKLYFDTQIIQNSFQNYNTISSTSQVNKIRFRIINYILSKHEKLAVITPLQKREGILLNYVHRCQEDK